MQAMDTVIRKDIKIIDVLVLSMPWITCLGSGQVHRNTLGRKEMNTNVKPYSFCSQCLP